MYSRRGELALQQRSPLRFSFIYSEFSPSLCRARVFPSNPSYLLGYPLVVRSESTLVDIGLGLTWLRLRAIPNFRVV